MSNYTEQIVNNSMYLTHYLNKPAKGRRSLVSSEFADYGKITAMSMTPEDKSSFILIPLYMPEIFMLSDDENDKRVCKGILNYIAQTCKAVDGIQDKTLERQDPDYKTQFFNTPMFTNLTGATKEITMSIPTELSGCGITDFWNHWLNQIKDEFTGFSPYNGLDIEWNNWSHSCGWAYIKPSRNLTRVSYGALWFQAVPINVPMSNYNADRTSTAITELSLQWSVSMIDTRNILVREMCESLLAKYKALLVIDSAQHGSVKNTYLESIEDLDAEEIIDSMTIGG